MPEPMPDRTSASPAPGGDPLSAAARAFFEPLRDRICAAFENLEDEAAATGAPVMLDGAGGDLPAGRFAFTPWTRDDPSGGPGGGGVMGMMKGRLFEKVGVNVSTVFGTFSPDFAGSMPGAEADPRFFATGISLVAHMRNPHVPAVHMNLRRIATTRAWFGGGSDLNPALPVEADTAEFKAAFAAACDARDPGYWPRFSKWCDEYFFVPHRGRARGVGGIFFDQLATVDPDTDFAFVRDVGEAFLHVYPALVRRRMGQPFDADARLAQLRHRGLYAEFNLVYDRGTLFGLKTGGNVDAILMSLPPEARWD